MAAIFNMFHCQKKRRIRCLSVSFKNNGIPSRNANRAYECKYAQHNQRDNGRTKPEHDRTLRIDCFLGKICNALNAKKKPNGKRNRGKHAMPSKRESILI